MLGLLFKAEGVYVQLLDSQQHHETKTAQRKILDAWAKATIITEGLNCSLFKVIELRTLDQKTNTKALKIIMNLGLYE